MTRRTTPRTSALIRGTVMHARRDAHAQRTFRYPVYIAALDLAELPALHRELRLFSHGGANLFAFHDRDYAAGTPSVAAGLADLLAGNGLPAPHTTRLVTNLRVAGYVFNPASFFLNYDAAGALTSVVAEVNNTYGGRRRYLLGPDQRIRAGRPAVDDGTRVAGPGADDATTAIHDKRAGVTAAHPGGAVTTSAVAFVPGGTATPSTPPGGRTRVGFRHVRELFVSPFLHGEATYDFWFDAPLDGDRLAITMHVDRPDGERVFVARLAGTRHPLTDRALLAAAVRYPLMTAQVIGLIHLEAAKLRLRGVPYLRPGADHRPRPEPPRVQPLDRPRPRAVEVPCRHVPEAASPAAAGLPHPLVIPLRRLAPVAGQALRWLAIARLRAGWTGGRLDLILPSGERARIGPPGTADACARIHDDRVFLRLLLRGELGAGEAFIAGEWSSDDLVGVLRLVLRATGARGIESPLTRLGQLPTLLRHRRAANTPHGSQRNIHAHYDLGNAFYQRFLDPETLSYSCALFTPPGASSGSRASPTLAEAQLAKLDRLCDLLALSPRDHLLEIGCGWGGMAIHAARTRGCRVTAITVSRQQHALASARVQAAGLADRVSIQLRDYREPDGRYDKLVSIEMIEAVGYEFLPQYFAIAARRLVPGGRFALQSITMPDARFDTYRRRVDWMQTYIFPGSLIPSLRALGDAAEPAGFTIAQAHDIGPDYAPTLRAWRTRFLAELPAITALGFDAPFVRTWLMYLAFSEAAFAERTLGDHQLLLTSSR